MKQVPGIKMTAAIIRHAGHILLKFYNTPVHAVREVNLLIIYPRQNGFTYTAAKFGMVTHVGDGHPPLSTFIYPRQRN